MAGSTEVNKYLSKGGGSGGASVLLLLSFLRLPGPSRGPPTPGASMVTVAPAWPAEHLCGGGRASLPGQGWGTVCPPALPWSDAEPVRGLRPQRWVWAPDDSDLCGVSGSPAFGLCPSASQVRGGCPPQLGCLWSRSPHHPSPARQGSPAEEEC